MADIDSHLCDMSGARLGTAANPVYVTIHTPALSEYGVPQKRVFDSSVAHKIWFKMGRLWLWVGRRMKWTI